MDPTLLLFTCASHPWMSLVESPACPDTPPDRDHEGPSLARAGPREARLSKYMQSSTSSGTFARSSRSSESPADDSCVICPRRLRRVTPDRVGRAAAQACPIGASAAVAGTSDTSSSRSTSSAKDTPPPSTGAFHVIPHTASLHLRRRSQSDSGVAQHVRRTSERIDDEPNRLGGAADGQLAMHRVATWSQQRRTPGAERDDRVTVDVEEVCTQQVGVAHCHRRING